MRVLSRLFRCTTATSLSAWVFLSSARLMGSSDSVCQSNSPTPQHDNFITRSSHTMPHNLEKAKQEALWGMFIGDAIAMPVHWYYNPHDIKRGYGGWLTGYTAPAKRHPSSILTLSAVDGSGRTGWGSKKKAVVGNVILHDKLKYWASGDRSTHYHQGMSAGDNTLNAMTALQTLRVMQKVDPEGTIEPSALREAVMENYVRFMTTPGTHSDTYAESFHRGFFQDWSNLDHPPKDGKDIVDFSNKRYTAVERSGHEDHQLAAVGALVLTIPWILHYAHHSADECVRLTVEAMKLTHPAPSLMSYVDLYARTLHAVLNGRPLKDQVLAALSSKLLGGNRKKEAVEKLSQHASKRSAGSEARLEVYQEAISQLGLACYIDGSLPSLLFLAHEFHDDFTQGVLANANCGGENVHRGAALAALLGAEAANHGEGVPRDLKEGLHSSRSDVIEVMKSKI